MAIASLALGLGSAVFAANTTGNQPSNPQRSEGVTAQNPTARTETSTTSQPHEDPRGWHASTLTGRDVVGVNDVKLGQLDDFIVDSDSGKITYGVVSSAGMKGAGGGLRAVPFPAFVPELAEGRLRMRLNIEEAAWTKAPQFEKDQLGKLSEDLFREDTYRHFGLQPPIKTLPTNQRLMLVSETVGQEVRRGEQSIGRIENVIVHLDSHMAAALLDPRDDFVGTDQKFILPFRSLGQDEKDQLSITLSPQDFTSAQVSTDATWAMSTSSFRSPYLWPAYGTSATPLANTPPPVQSRGLAASRPPVEEIRQALAEDVHTRSYGIRVVAANDRVILLGNVQDEDDKRRVESRAALSAGGWKIDNQIRTARSLGEQSGQLSQ